VSNLTNEEDWPKVLTAVNKVMNGCMPVKYKLVEKHKLVGAFVKNDACEKFPYLFLEYKRAESCMFLAYYLSKNLLTIEEESIRILTHGSRTETWNQYATFNDLPITNWIEILHYTRVDVASEKWSICDNEYTVNGSDLRRAQTDMVPPHIGVLAYDIETYQSNPKIFCDPNRENDKIFMVSMIFEHDVILITRCNVNDDVIRERFVGKQVKVWFVKTEDLLLSKFVEILHQLQPLIIVGYNNLGFDGPYMITRAKKYCWNMFKRFTLSSRFEARDYVEEWTSTNQGAKSFSFMKGEGFITIDCMAMIKIDFKLPSYKLNDVASHFLNSKKDDMAYDEMFRAYSNSMLDQTDVENTRVMTLVGMYCLMDSILVLDLMDKMKMINSVMSMSDITYCPIQELVIKGQTVKVKNLILRFCHRDDFVVNSSMCENSSSFRGAVVFEPLTGYYKNVVSFDFQGLYPTIIKEYNLCTSTLVDAASPISDDKCIVMEWQDHVNCIHDERLIEMKNAKLLVHKAMMASKQDSGVSQEYLDLKKQLENMSKYNPTSTFCDKRKFRWIKSSVYMGILPKICTWLLDQRRKVRLVIKQKSSELASIDEARRLNLEIEIISLDAQQKALKVCVNSVYGFTGSKNAIMPAQPIAMCTTYTGRQLITRAKQEIETKYGGLFLYGDTDSNYITFPHISGYKALFDYCCMVSENVSLLFPGSLLLDFEQTIYASWLIINKKKYGYTELLPSGQVKMTIEDGKSVPKLGAKGLLLVRRDNCEFVRRIYRRVILAVFDGTSIGDISNFVMEACLEMIRFQNNKADFKYNKAVNEVGDGTVTVDGSGKRKCGAYTLIVPKKQCKDVVGLYGERCVVNEHEYLQSCLPPNAQLAQRIMARGNRVEPGERLDYIVHDPNLAGPMFRKCEEYAFFCRNSHVYRIDYIYYINALCTSLTPILAVLTKNDSSRFVPFDYFGILKRTRTREARSLNDQERSQLNLNKYFNEQFKKVLAVDLCQRFLVQMKNKHKVINEITSLFKPRMIF
jgi:DNA polymerase elongation subunit (family B)